MVFEIEEIRLSQQIFYYLLQHRELEEEKSEELYKAYTENERIMELVKNQGEAAECIIELYGSVIYLIPKEENDYLGYSKKQLKVQLCRAGATEKDYYLSQFVILTFLSEVYDAQGNSSKSRNFIKVGELINLITDKLEEGTKREEEKGREEKTGLSFCDMKEAFEALKSEEKGSRAKTTKEGFLYHILKFLKNQGLIEFIEVDEMIYTTQKLDHFMDFNLLNKNNYSRVRNVIKNNQIEDK